MPESKPRKRKSAPRKAAPRKSPGLPNPNQARPVGMLSPAEDNPIPEPKPNRSPVKEIPEEDRFKFDLPEPASYEQVLVALMEMDPLAQEVMIAQRIAAMPSQRDGGMPVNIHRMVRGPWAHQLRKLGIFCIPELATHELVAPDAAGMMVNHTAMTLRKIDADDIWEIAKQQDPALAKMVEGAKTPEQKRDAMRKLAAKLPVEQRIALERLNAVTPEDLEPR